MTDTLKISRALLSVSDKTGIVDFAKSLASHGIKLLSTGGTFKTLKDAGLDVQDVSSYTGFPEIMDGRVKTLHPRVHGGLLARRDNADHVKAMGDHGIEGIDLVVINLYPFVETLKGGGDFNECIENIDIGGPAMIRASAKNHEFVTLLTDPADYPRVLDELSANGGSTTLNLRRELAAKAFSLTAYYDSQIAGWLSPKDSWPKHISFAGTLAQSLRYGENPHQGAALYMDESSARPGAARAKQVQGKELSYNNLNDTNAAFELVSEFDAPSIAIIKHANPCGVASGSTMLEAYERALACDSTSAFGGIIALNRPLDAATAEAITKMFVEVIIAPSVEAAALPLLAKKDKIRVLTTGTMPAKGEATRTITRIAGGFLVQDADIGAITESDLKLVTKRAPTADELADMIFAFRVAKHVKSNAIVYARDLATVGIGAGQMSRIDSSRIAAWKMKEAFKDAPASPHLALASDAFFPFADGLIAAAEAGVTAVIQPGGSIRDDEVIAAADERGLAMMFTGMRHFRH